MVHMYMSLQKNKLKGHVVLHYLNLSASLNSLNKWKMLVAHLGFNCSALTQNFFISGFEVQQRS